MYIVNEVITMNKRRVFGKFKLSDRSITNFEMLKGDNWFQWGNTTDNLCLTVARVEEICNAYNEKFGY